VSKRIFIAATMQNDGKTTVSMGLIFNFKERFKNIGFIKPIGQRYLEEDGQKIDEDSILIEDVCRIKCGIKDMSPIAVEKGFTEKYILNPDKESIDTQIQESFERVSRDKEFVVIEGTGHAGVGSVFDHSNAAVAKLLGAKVILVSSGGVGRPIDEIMLNKALFEKEGVGLLGVIINKVRQDKFDKIRHLVKDGLKRLGVNVLGVMPYQQLLSYPTMRQIWEETKFKVFSGNECLDHYIAKIVIGAMEPHNALNFMQPNSLLITPGDREDLIMTALGLHIAKAQVCPTQIAGIILTGGFMPHKEVVGVMKSTNVPVFLTDLDTYATASLIHDLTVKIRPQDTDKIETVKNMVKDYVAIDEILRLI
jgi:BioD-like phosphotransacetylase family protein